MAKKVSKGEKRKNSEEKEECKERLIKSLRDTLYCSNSSSRDVADEVAELVKKFVKGRIECLGSLDQVKVNGDLKLIWNVLVGYLCWLILSQQCREKVRDKIENLLRMAGKIYPRACRIQLAKALLKCLEGEKDERVELLVEGVETLSPEERGLRDVILTCFFK